jgi:hypothetical protein
LKRHTNYSRISISLVLVVICVGLISLGLRVPSLTGVSSSSKPKPRPRATVQTQIKTCKEKICHVDQDALVIKVFSLAPTRYILFSDIQETPVSERPIFVSTASSRASPFFS